MILILGDAFVDVYHLGKVRGLSAEAPIPVVDVTEVKRFAGGAGNVRKNLEVLGVATSFIAGLNIPRKNRLMAGDFQLAL